MFSKYKSIILTSVSVCIIAASFICPALSRPGDGALNLKQNLAAITQQNPAFADAKCAVYIKTADTGRVIYSYNGQTPMIPASNMKIATTSAALCRLGPSFRFRTDLRGPKPDSSGIVKGNVYLRGTGDPTITPPYIQTDEFLNKFAKQMKKAGVRCIEGDLVADDSAFDRRFLPDGWMEHYRLDIYSAPVSALSFNGNLIEVIVNGSNIRLEPPCSAIKIDDRTNLGGGLSINRERGSNTIVVTGQCVGEERRAVPVENPPMFMIGSFYEVLRANGIECRGKVRSINQMGEPAVVDSLYRYAMHESPPLYEIINEINRHSDNLFAEHVFRAIGANLSGRGTPASGEAAVKSFMLQNNINAKGLKMVDGCGLSRLDRITPCQIVGCLEAMSHHAYGKYFKDSLPVPGRGTLCGRLGGIKVAAKTGTLANDSSLSGYVTTAAGQTLLFSLLFNDIDYTGLAVDTQDQIVEMLANVSEKL